MSRVYFHSLSGEAELSGSERSYLRYLCNHIALGFVDGGSVPRLAALLDTPIYGGHGYRDINGTQEPTEQDFRLWWSVHDDYSTSKLWWQGHQLRTWHISLNTAYLLGSEHVQLAARIDTQCELHGWVDGPNRAWLADLMQSGVEDDVYRETLSLENGKVVPQGWSNVISLLRARDDEPVVMSYSVTRSFFTDAAYASTVPQAWMDEHHKDHFEEDPPPCPQCHSDYFATLPLERRWAIGMDWLKSTGGKWLELKPDQFGRFAHYYFDDSVTLLDLLSNTRDEILTKVFSSDSQPAWELRR